MRIVQAVGWYHPESLGGTEVYVAALCARLRAAGQEVVVAAPSPGAASEARYEHDGVPVYRYPIPAAPTRDEAQGLVAARGAERFHAWLARERPDVVHAHTFVSGLGLHEIRAARAAGARVIVTTHAASLGFICQRGTMMRMGRVLCDGLAEPGKCAACALEQRGVPAPIARAAALVPIGASRALGRMRGRFGTALGMPALIARNQAMQAEMIASVDRFVVLTQWALETVASNGAPSGKLALNRLGLSQPKPDPKPGPERQPTRAPITVGYLGRFDRIKGVLDLARAATSLPREVPIRVEFRGPEGGPAERAVVAEIRRLAAGDPRVTVESAVSPADAPRVLGRWDLLCCPSLTLEGGPTVAIEAHAVGTPVIGARIGGLAELVTDGVNGRLIQPGDWRGLATCLREAASDPAGTIDRWRAAVPPVRTMDDIAADYLALYAA